MAGQVLGFEANYPIDIFRMMLGVLLIETPRHLGKLTIAPSKKTEASWPKLQVQRLAMDIKGMIEAYSRHPAALTRDIVDLQIPLALLGKTTQ